MSQACHRSLYSYQLRTALALAVENPHVAVTFLPLACTGATIESGLLGTPASATCAASSRTSVSGATGSVLSLETASPSYRFGQDRKSVV